MDKHMRLWIVPGAILILSSGFFLCGCQMKGTEKAGAKKKAGAAQTATAQEDFNRGLEFYNKGLWTDAITAFNHAIKMEPGNAGFYSARGNTYVKMGNIPFAIVDFSKAIELNPKTAEFYNNRAKAYFAVNEYENALADANKAEGLGLNVAEFKKRVMQAGKIFGAKEFVLSGILVDNNKGYLAIINNEIVGVGSVVNQAKVIRITQYYVKLDRDGEIITKTIPSSDVTQQPATVVK